MTYPKLLVFIDENRVILKLFCLRMLIDPSWTVLGMIFVCLFFDLLEKKLKNPTIETPVEKSYELIVKQVNELQTSVNGLLIKAGLKL